MPKPKRLTGTAAFERLQAFVAAKGGECLSRVYRTARTEMRFRCARGHTWRAEPIRITSGGIWCQDCRRAERLEKLQEIATSHGGVCLAKRYSDVYGHYRMQCAQGHIWAPRAIDTLAGHWCPTCRRVGRPPAYTLEDVKKAARKRKGVCLSTSYRHVTDPLKFECQAGHRFTKTFSSILEGSWCRFCVHEDLRLGIEAAAKIAAARGGRCLSKDYRNTSANLEWECAKGHRWFASLGNVKGGTWCAACKKLKRLTLDDMHAVAAERSGKCISTHYKNTTTHLIWECADGHRWRATAKNVRQHGTWCPACARGMSVEEIERRRRAHKPIGKWAGMLVLGALNVRSRQSMQGKLARS